MTSFLTSRRLRGGLTGVAVAAMVVTTAACGGTTRDTSNQAGSAGSGSSASANPDAKITDAEVARLVPTTEQQFNSYQVPDWGVLSANMDSVTERYNKQVGC